MVIRKKIAPNLIWDKNFLLNVIDNLFVGR